MSEQDDSDRPRCELCGKRVTLHDMERKACRAGLVYDRDADALVQAWRCGSCARRKDTGIPLRGGLVDRQRTKKH